MRDPLCSVRTTGVSRRVSSAALLSLLLLFGLTNRQASAGRIPYKHSTDEQPFGAVHAFLRRHLPTILPEFVAAWNVLLREVAAVFMIGSWVDLWVFSVPVRDSSRCSRRAKLLRRFPRVVRVTDPQAEAKAGTVSPQLCPSPLSAHTPLYVGTAPFPASIVRGAKVATRAAGSASVEASRVVCRGKCSANRQT